MHDTLKMDPEVMERDTLMEEQVCADGRVERDTRMEETVCADGRVERDTLMEEHVCSDERKCHDTLSALRKGELPASMEEATAVIAYLSEFGKISLPSISMLLAYARTQFGNIQDWVDWAEKCSGLEGDDLHHRRAIGDVLLAYRTSAYFQTLFSLDQQKMLALYRIHRSGDNALTPFLARYPQISKMTRDAVRDAVTAWLGEKPGKAQLLLPGFDRFIESIYAANSDALANTVQSYSQAEKASVAARRLVDAAKSYFGAEADIQAMSLLRSQLTEMIAELDGDIRFLSEPS